MGKKKSGHKATKKLAKSGQLKKNIQARHRHRNVKKRIERKNAKAGAHENVGSVVSDEEMEEKKDLKDGKKNPEMTIDDLLGGKFMEGEMEEEDLERTEDEDEDDSDNSDSLVLDSLDDNGKQHMVDLAKLAETDPEFYKYLQENDEELLRFDPGVASAEEDGPGDENPSTTKASTLTEEMLNGWKKNMLEKGSLRALRKLFVAFRSAISDDEEADQTSKTRYLIASASVRDKLIDAALQYPPVILQQHLPYKTLSNGKVKPPPQNSKQKMLSKLILSYFNNILRMLDQSSDSEMQALLINSSAKMLPYVVSSRKSVKNYLNSCLELWSKSADDVRIAAFMAMRRLGSFDSSILDQLLKGSYLTLVRSCKHTTGFTIKPITLMKNTAAELYCLDHSASYQHAFRYIRQLAMHLRTSVKTKTKDSFTLVYNWQFAHCVDFWCILISQACSPEYEAKNGESDLKALLYPLVQVALGSIRIISNSRSYPFHLQIIRSVLRLCQQTRTYIPLGPYLLPIFQSILSPNSKPKPATLKSLDLEVNIRAPSQYLSTRVYSESLAEESVYLLAEWLGTRQLQGSIAYPELIVPLIAPLRKAVKASKGGKETAQVKSLIEHAEEGANWVAQRRRDVKFGPRDFDQVTRWEDAIELEETPMGKWLKVLRKLREKRMELVAKSRTGEDVILSD